MFGPQDDAPLALIPLRRDLDLHEAPPLENGAPTWTLHDPVRKPVLARRLPVDVLRIHARA